MSKSIDAQKQSIGNLLGRYERRAVVLPEFQRAYSWEKAQVATFWGDLIAFKAIYLSKPLVASYFLGPIVSLPSESEIVLLDGQQRLATATILLAALRDHARTLTGDTSGSDFARDIQRELLEKDTDPPTYSLRLSELDQPYFLARIQRDPPTAASVSVRSHLLIESASEYLKDEIQKLTAGKTNADAIKELKGIKDALTIGMTLVAITVGSEEDAYSIFESLNDRGLRLSVPDLVANLLLRRCTNSAERRIVRQKWNSIIQQMGRKDVSRFLRHLWLSRHGDLKARGLFTEIKESLDGAKSSIDFATSCEEECSDYATLLDCKKDLPKHALRDLEGLVRHLSVTSAMPLLLSGYRCLSESDFQKLVKIVVSLYVRHSLISNLNPLELETAFYDAAREIRAQHGSGAKSTKCFKRAKTILLALNPTDSAVMEAAKNLILERTEATWLMTEIANSMQSKTKEIGMDKANVEHIFPQNADAAWPNRAKLEQYIWHIGNLTILGNRLNQKAQNKAFTDKCKDHFSKSEIEMTKALLKESTWDEGAIERRAAALAKVIVDIWK